MVSIFFPRVVWVSGINQNDPLLLPSIIIAVIDDKQIDYADLNNQLLIIGLRTPIRQTDQSPTGHGVKKNKIRNLEF